MSLNLSHYRNLCGDAFVPDAGVNILYGNNAQGKTNLLEAIWLFTGSRSFRGAKDAELVRFGETQAALTLRFEAQQREQTAEITIRDARRHATLNGVKKPAASRLAGSFCGVIFSPSHLSLVKDGPEGRRRFLDAAYCQLRPGYLPVLADFQRALSQRNALLKEQRRIGGEETLLEIWDDRLAATGARVILARTAYIRRLAPLAAAIYSGLSGGHEQLSVFYQPTGGISPDAPLSELAAQLKQAFLAARGADFAAGFTTVGPHRDDLGLHINELPARTYGSQGQQRSVVLALKLAEASVLEKVTGEKPVALLDDVMSELDEQRQDYILNHIHDWQVFITCCEPSAVMRMTGGQTFHVKQGMWTNESDERRENNAGSGTI